MRSAIRFARFLEELKNNNPILNCIQELTFPAVCKCFVIVWKSRTVYSLLLKTFLGTKSEVLDVDNPNFEKYPLFVKAKRYECYLEAGDVLFIPGM